MPTDYTKENFFKREYDRLYSLVLIFGIYHAKNEGWEESTDEAYMEIIDEIDLFRAKLTRNNMEKLIENANELDKMATRYKIDCIVELTICTSDMKKSMTNYIVL